MERARPVFLHCGWRTAGTWLWSAYRARPDVTAFYEPLHECMASLSLTSMAAMRPSTSDLGHPDDGRSYFQEYAELLSPRPHGARGFRPAFAYDEFFARDAGRTGTGAWLRVLVERAGARRSAPVLKFCRSLGRVGALRRAFPGAAHVVVLREPWGQWTSAWRVYERTGNAYFLGMPLHVLHRHRHDPLVAAACAALRIPPARLAAAARPDVAAAGALTLPPRLQFRAATAFWVLCAFAAIPHADLVVESERLGRSRTYRAAIENALSDLTGLPVALNDAREIEANDEAMRFAFDADGCFRDAAAACDALAALRPDGEAVRRLLGEKLQGPVLSTLAG